MGPKLCGLYADNQLLGCGDYVDFVPRKLPHIVCPAIAQQHQIWFIKKCDPSERSELRFSLSRFKNGVVCSSSPPRALVLGASKGVQPVQLAAENVVKGSLTSPS